MMQNNQIEPSSGEDGEQNSSKSGPDDDDFQTLVTEEEVETLSAEIDALNNALDKLEEQNDLISSELRNILRENQKAREERKDNTGPRRNSDLQSPS